MCYVTLEVTFTLHTVHLVIPNVMQSTTYVSICSRPFSWTTYHSLIISHWPNSTFLGETTWSSVWGHIRYAQVGLIIDTRIHENPVSLFLGSSLQREKQDIILRENGNTWASTQGFCSMTSVEVQYLPKFSKATLFCLLDNIPLTFPFLLMGIG